MGGSAKRAGLAKIMNDGCHILVGTPGRLNDILSDSREGVRAPKLSAFVLDEADRLLDAGFAPEIRQIESLLPDKRQPGSDRQTLMFSATVPKEVVQIVNSFMKRDYTFVRTIQPGEQETHERVPQRIVRLEGLENFLPALLELCKQGIDQSDPNMPFKAMVFFNATAEVMLAAATFQGLRKSGTSRNPLGDLPLIEIHARLTQMERTRASDTFRRARSAIMFTSDVTARGMDFPNVTHVIQVGLPPTKDTYIHRLGRTARGDKKGEGWLLSPKLEGSEARYRLKGLPLKSDSSLATAAVDMTQDAQIPASVAENLSQIIESSRRLPERLKHAAYISSIGSYTWISQKQQLIDAMNTRSKFAWGLDEPPMVSSSWARKLGLNGLKGLKLGERDDRGSSSRSFGDRDSRGSASSGSRFSPSRDGFSGDRGRGRYEGGRGLFGNDQRRDGERSRGGRDRYERSDRGSSGEDRGRYGRDDRGTFGGEKEDFGRDRRQARRARY